VLLFLAFWYVYSEIIELPVWRRFLERAAGMLALLAALGVFALFVKAAYGTVLDLKFGTDRPKPLDGPAPKLSPSLLLPEDSPENKAINESRMRVWRNIMLEDQFRRHVEQQTENPLEAAVRWVLKLLSNWLPTATAVVVGRILGLACGGLVFVASRPSWAATRVT
jgi:hypothetical protein